MSSSLKLKRQVKVINAPLNLSFPCMCQFFFFKEELPLNFFLYTVPFVGLLLPHDFFFSSRLSTLIDCVFYHRTKFSAFFYKEIIQLLIRDAIFIFIKVNPNANQRRTNQPKKIFPCLHSSNKLTLMLSVTFLCVNCFWVKYKTLKYVLNIDWFFLNIDASDDFELLLRINNFYIFLRITSLTREEMCMYGCEKH